VRSLQRGTCIQTFGTIILVKYTLRTAETPSLCSSICWSPLPVAQLLEIGGAIRFCNFQVSAHASSSNAVIENEEGPYCSKVRSTGSIQIAARFRSFEGGWRDPRADRNPPLEPHHGRAEDLRQERRTRDVVALAPSLNCVYLASWMQLVPLPYLGWKVLSAIGPRPNPPSESPLTHGAVEVKS
jgi:hypothetical protein